MEISDRLKQKLFEAIETGIVHALTRRDVPGNDEPLDITVPQDSSVYNKHDRMFYEILNYVKMGWSCPDGNPEKEMTDRLHEMIDEETLDFFTRIMVDFCRIDGDCRELIDSNHMREIFIDCLDYKGDLDYKDEKCNWSRIFLSVDWHNGTLHNFLNVQTKEILSSEWFSEAFDFENGFSIIKNDEKRYNYLDMDGNVLLDEWMFRCEDFHDPRYAFVWRFNSQIHDKECNVINRKGELMFDRWFDNVYYEDGRDPYQIEIYGNSIELTNEFGDSFESDRSLN